MLLCCIWLWELRIMSYLSRFVLHGGGRAYLATGGDIISIKKIRKQCVSQEIWVASYKQQKEFLSGDIGDPYTYWAADLSNKHFAYSIDVHQVLSSWLLPYSTYLYLNFHLLFCSMTKIKEYSREIHQVLSQLTFFISDNNSMADVDTFFSISGSAAIAITQHKTKTKRTANTKIPKPKKTQIPKIPSKHKYKIKHKHEKTWTQR